MPSAEISTTLFAAAYAFPAGIGLAFLVGMIVGSIVNLWSVILADHGSDRLDESADAPHRQPSISSPWWQLIPVIGTFTSREAVLFRGHPIRKSALFAELGTGLLFAFFSVAYIHFDCQQISEVRPDDFWKSGRLVYHLLLVTFLVAATATDLRDYIIPDAITIPGTLIGIAVAAIAGQLQMIHLWVDWSQEIPGLQGPYIPAWLDAHRHLHGLAWSLVGGALGAGITLLVVVVSRWVLGRDAMGLGDVTLMAMIGSYIGWQPVLFVFFLAPMTGLLTALGSYFSGRRAILPYGPCLSAAAFGVICTWKWLWLPMRHSFGDATLLAVLGTAAFVAFVVLLGLIRLMQSISVRRNETE